MFNIKIVKKESYRSVGKPVNKNDDMYRITLDIHKVDYNVMKKILKDNNFNIKDI